MQSTYILEKEHENGDMDVEYEVGLVDNLKDLDKSLAKFEYPVFSSMRIFRRYNFDYSNNEVVKACRSFWYMAKLCNHSS